jgi:hypothetical protein
MIGASRGHSCSRRSLAFGGVDQGGRRLGEVGRGDLACGVGRRSHQLSVVGRGDGRCLAGVDGR